MADARDRALAALPTLITVNPGGVTCPRCSSEPGHVCAGKSSGAYHGERRVEAERQLAANLKTLFEG